MTFKTAVLTTALVSAGIALPAAKAATTSSTMPVTITIQNACNVSSVAPTTLNFGTQGPLLAAVTLASTITITFSTSARYNSGFGGGTSGNVNARTMVNGA